MNLGIALAERGILPDRMVRWGIRRMLARRLGEEKAAGVEAQQQRLTALLAELRDSPIAIETGAANEQHYALPTEFFTRMLGPRLKYSCCLWENRSGDLAAAEERMLECTCRRAEIEDGMTVLDLGCGWGSLSLWIAENFPRSQVVAVSNSPTQREHIERACRERGLGNVSVVTRDVNELDLDRSFDRVVSVEMLEHVRNYGKLLERVARWLRPGGRFFVHIFCHRFSAYPYESRDGDDWMSRHFFSGGMMPSENLLLFFCDHWTLEERWRVDGRHYERTLLAWLDRLDGHRGEVLKIFERSYGPADARLWFQRWRLFLLACAGLFGYASGQEWYVAHYRFRPRT